MRDEVLRRASLLMRLRRFQPVISPFTRRLKTQGSPTTNDQYPWPVQLIAQMARKFDLFEGCPKVESCRILRHDARVLVPKAGPRKLGAPLRGLKRSKAKEGNGNRWRASRSAVNEALTTGDYGRESVATRVRAVTEVGQGPAGTCVWRQIISRVGEDVHQSRSAGPPATFLIFSPSDVSPRQRPPPRRTLATLRESRCKIDAPA